METEKRCRYCGNRLPMDAAFCSYCGAPTGLRRIETVKAKSEPSHDSSIRDEAPRFSLVDIAHVPESKQGPLPQRIGFFSRLTNVIRKPNQAFEYLSIYPDFKGAFIVFLVGVILNSVSLALLFSKITFIGDLSSLIPEIGDVGISAEELSSLVQGILPGFIIGFSFFGALIGLAISAAIYWVIAKIFGGVGSYKGTLVLVGYSSLPAWILGVKDIILAYMSPGVTIDLTNMFSFNPLTASAAFSLPIFLLSSLIGLWQAFLVSYGLHYTHKLKFRTAMIAAVGVWILGIILNIGF
ncbi:MAG: YIP1 family protein [Candidatus Ranarchaeia archaeon]